MQELSSKPEGNTEITPKPVQDKEIEKLYSDLALACWVVIALLRDSSKNRYTSIDDIMASNAIHNGEFTREKVLWIIYESGFFYLFSHQGEKGAKDSKVSIQWNYFFTLKETRDPNSLYNTQSRQ